MSEILTWEGEQRAETAQKVGAEKEWERLQEKLRRMSSLKRRGVEER